MRKPLLSVIVTTYTLSRLPDALEVLGSLNDQSYPHIEVVFVGEREPDLCHQVEEFANKHDMGNVVSLFNDGEPGLSAARNVGIDRARGEIVAFVDDDVVLSPEWADEVIRAFDDDSVVGVTGPATPLWENPQMAWFPEELYWVMSCTSWSEWEEQREVRSAWGMNMAFRREAFDVAGLFDNNTGYHKGPLAEDNEFSLRVRAATGKSIVYIPGAKVWHKVHPYRLSLSFIRSRAYWIGRSRRNLSRLYPSSGEEALKPERDLLGRILKRRVLRDLASLPVSPATSLKRLFVTLWALGFVAAGYYCHLLPGKNDSAEGFQGKGKESS